jgi:hypothetical protein
MIKNLRILSYKHFNRFQRDSYFYYCLRLHPTVQPTRNCLNGVMTDDNHLSRATRRDLGKLKKPIIKKPTMVSIDMKPYECYNYHGHGM